MRRDQRSTVQIAADQIDMDLYRLAGRIDQLAEMEARGGRKMDPALVEAARKVDAARGAVRKHMHRADVIRTSPALATVEPRREQAA